MLLVPCLFAHPAITVIVYEYGYLFRLSRGRFYNHTKLMSVKFYFLKHRGIKLKII
jgi:hypothetical protein